ncbi:MAG: AAA family ATPase [Steroidobacteraceae bacterium]|jgi:general secretion pathway protein A
MYLQFFGLTEMPFAITPDPRYLYLSVRHADALAHLVYGINEAGGFIQLTGEVGTGKTTTIRSLLARAPKNAEIALILNPRLSASEFLHALCGELGLAADDSSDGQTKALVDLLNRYLLNAHAHGQRVVLIVDEAQNLAPDVLEQVRLLTNLETETHKLLQIILIGQPELRKLLAREDLRQIAQRITARYHLEALSSDETYAYVRHRLRVAGATADIFTRAALRAVHRASGGVPRLINVLCDRALLGAYTQDLHEVPASLVRRAAAEVFGQEPGSRWMPAALACLALAVLAGSAVLLWRHAPAQFTLHLRGRPTPARAQAPAAVLPAAATSAPAAAPDATDPAAATPAARTDPSMANLAQLLAAYRDSTNTDSAFLQLLTLWKASYVPSSTDGCTQAKAQGLQCLAQRGSLAQLRLLNRPAILMLSDDSGSMYQVVLRGLTDEAAQVQIGTHLGSVAIAELARYWFGDFVLVWRPATKSVQDLSAGMHGLQVRRLREQLDRWRGAQSPTPGDDYDENLMRLVEQFQRANRLSVDGVAGIETQVALDAAIAAPDSPLLAPPSSPAGTRGG